MPTATSISCLCRNVSEPPSLLSSSTLPIASEICHCNPCRQTSGALCPAFLELRGPPSQRSLSVCTCYDFSGKSQRYFCSKCGARAFDFVAESETWFVCSGLVEPDRDARDVVKVTSHDYVDDTGDGGLAAVMCKPGGRDIPLYAAGRDGPIMTDSEVSQIEKKESTRRESKLLASCHCGAIEFHILPPEAAGDSIQDPEVRRWLRIGGTKYLALNCACNSCRRGSGFSFVSNAYVMPENIVTIDDDRKSLFSYTSRDDNILDFENSFRFSQALLPVLKCYDSSLGIRRSFCGACGALVFFESAARPQCVNVTVGILRAKSGSLAKDWIDFNWEVWWSDDAVDHEMVQALQALR